MVVVTTETSNHLLPRSDIKMLDNSGGLATAVAANNLKRRSYTSSKDWGNESVSAGPYGKGVLVAGCGRIVRVNGCDIPASMNFAAVLKKIQEEFPLALELVATDIESDEFADEKKSEDMEPPHRIECREEEKLPTPSSDYTIFVQSSTGAFFPAESITNASVVAVRPSVATALPRGSTVQWYRGDDRNNQWTPLEGATRPLFQPTAVDVGFNLRCRVENPDGGVSITHTTVPIHADKALWNAARHTAAAGFVLTGRGPATGRTIRMAVQPTGNVVLHQQNKGDRVPLTEHPVPVVTARSGTQPKQLAVQLTAVPPDCLLAALVEEDSVLELTAPNRMARESVLLAIGIANYRGENELDATARLYGGVFCDISTINESPSLSEKEETFDEVTSLREKLARKDKIIAELQRQLADSDADIGVAKSQAQAHQQELAAERESHEATRKTIVQTENRVRLLETERQRLATTHSTEVRNLQSQLQDYSTQAASAVKAHKAIQNEVTILSATLAARENKLSELKNIQEDCRKAQDSLAELQQAHRMCQEELAEAKQNVVRMTAARSEAETSRQEMETKLEEAERECEEQTSLAKACRDRLSQEQVIVQKIKAERNSYQQRVESLAKEMSRVCRNGRTVRQVEQILADDAARREEVRVLRSQQQSIRTELDHWRKAHADAVRAATTNDPNSWARRERVAELERVVADLTAYVAAQDMQVTTLREVNSTLQTELRDLAQATQKSGEV